MSADRYQQYFPNIAASRKKLESYISEIKRMGEPLNPNLAGPPEYRTGCFGMGSFRGAAGRRNLTILALSFACTHSTGLYASEAIEKVFLELAGEHQILGEFPPFEKKHILHVVTQTYLVGGHTRVLERWIAQAEPGEKHSVVLLNQKKPAQIPPQLRDLVRDQTGDFLVYDHRESLLARALKLRRLGQSHEYVVLHVHPNDPIPLLAFGAEEFTRPVILFNHADHIFWCGVAVADLVLDLSRAGQERSLTRRGAAWSEILGIPLDSALRDKLLDRAQAKARLNWPADQKMVLTSGSSVKFRHIGGDGLAATLLKIIQTGRQWGVLAIGPDPRDPLWAKAVAESGGRLRLSPPVDYDKGYLDCLSAADLVLDSYPAPGYTATIDAVLAGRPVLSLKTALSQLDFLMASESYCQSEEELLSKADRILRDESYAREIAAGTLTQLERHHSVENWKRRRREILDQLPSRHRINRNFDPENHPEATDTDVLIGTWAEGEFFRKNKLRAFRHLFYQKHKGDNYRYLKILGRYLYFKNRIL